MKTAAIVICYNPDKDLLRHNIDAFAKKADQIIIWRNSPDNLEDIASEYSNIALMGDGTNRFIAYPLNRALEWCKARDYQWLLTMDQDSVWENFAGFSAKAMSVAVNDDIAVIVPNVNNEFGNEKETADVETAITSGSLINVEKALAIGGFNERYEIYWVDGEFCYRVRKNGMRVVMLPRFNLMQQFGRQTRTLFGFMTSNYSPLIYYYLTRNMLWEHREHGSQAVSLRCIAYTLMYTTRGIVLGEKHKLKKLAKITKGIMHGLFQSYK